MHKAGRIFLGGLALTACLATAGTARAVSYEDGLEDCHYPKMVDLFLMRPVGLFALGVGGLLFIPSAPWVAITSSSDFPYVWDTLLARPAQFTFHRPLGECVGNSQY